MILQADHGKAMRTGTLENRLEKLVDLRSLS